MSEDQIKANAPNGSTHFELDDDYLYYYRLCLGNLFIWNPKKGWIAKPIEWIKDAIPL